ncbi:MAG: hypothetical protein Q4B81_07460 [Moraxella sp.]|nr:hypothetical protein [Moraxella sp.]
MFGLVGCSQPTSPQPEQQVSMQYATPPLFGAPRAVVTMGRTKATKRFITRKWQVVSINNRPVRQVLFLDLRDFAVSRGEFYDGCERILVDLKTRDIASEKLLVDNSTRQTGDCNSELIDDIMWMLSDVYAFEREGDELLIVAVQDTLRLIPAD